MRIMVEKLLGQYGMEVRVGDLAVRALFQPVTGRLDRLALQDPGPTGLQSRQRYLYLAFVHRRYIDFQLWLSYSSHFREA